MISFYCLTSIKLAYFYPNVSGLWLRLYFTTVVPTCYCLERITCLPPTSFLNLFQSPLSFACNHTTVHHEADRGEVTIDKEERRLLLCHKRCHRRCYSEEAAVFHDYSSVLIVCFAIQYHKDSADISQAHIQSNHRGGWAGQGGGLCP